MSRRVVLVVGDTAGHTLPALAIAESYHDLAPGTELSFLATAGSAASALVPMSGLRLDLIRALPIMRVSAVRKLIAAAHVFRTVGEARRLLQRTGARLVIGTGGYATGGVILAARALRIRTAILEANVVPGLANRLLSRVAHRSYVAWDDAASFFPDARVVRTGLPVRRTIARLTASSLRVAPLSPARLLVTSGSRGDAFLAGAVPPVIAELQSSGVPVTVRHQVGSPELDRVRAAYARAGIDAVVTTFVDDMADAYATSDLVLARAGGGTVAELALAGLPAVLVPLADAASDHQAKNAAACERRGAALMVRERDWTTERVAAVVRSILHASRWQAMSEAMRALARPDAAGAVVRDCEQVMAGRW